MVFTMHLVRGYVCDLLILNTKGLLQADVLDENSLIVNLATNQVVDEGLLAY